VLDFSISPDGTQIFFSAANVASGSDLYFYDRLQGKTYLLLDCGTSRCLSPQFWPDGGLLAYQTQESGSPNSNRTIIWVSPIEGIDLGKPISIAVISEPTPDLAWSSLGQLIFHHAEENVFVFHDPLTGEETRLTNLTGAPGAWDPEGRVYLAPEILDASRADPDALTQPSHLMQLNPEANRSVSLTPGTNTENTDPIFAPNGQLVAFARRYLDPARWTPGRQLWTMAANGGELRQLTKEPLFTHTDFAWRPDGGQLAYTRFNQMTLTDPTEIWVVDPDGSNPLRLVIGGYDPQWIP
jgi:Tol biopolymer transport system component